MPALTKDIIEAAIDGFEAQKARLDAQIAELRSMLDGTQTSSPASPITVAIHAPRLILYEKPFLLQAHLV